MSNTKSDKLEAYYQDLNATQWFPSQSARFCILCPEFELEHGNLETKEPFVCDEHEVFIDSDELLVVYNIFKIMYGYNTPDYINKQVTTEASAKVTTEVTTEASAEVTTEASAKVTTEASAEVTTEVTTEETIPSNNITTLIVGNVASGKTTLSLSLDGCEPEDVKKWNMQSTGEFLSTLRCESLNNQIAFIMQTFLALDFLAKESKIQESGILGVIAHSVAKYLKNTMSRNDLFCFMQALTSLNLFKYNMVYLYTDPKLCLERIKKRNKGYDSHMTLKELMINQASMNLLYLFHRNPTLIVYNNDTNASTISSWIERFSNSSLWNVT